jgi:sugar lactone lactonase YvrE
MRRLLVHALVAAGVCVAFGTPALSAPVLYSTLESFPGRVVWFSDTGVATNVPGGSGFSQPYGLAIDPAGNFFVGDFWTRQIYKITPAGAVSPYATIHNSPSGLALDPSGVLYWASSFGGTVGKVTPDGTVTTMVSGLSAPQGITLDSAGNVYIAAAGDNTIRKMTPAGALTTFVGASAGLNQPQDVEFDLAGDLYVSNFNGARISKVTPSGFVSTFATGIGFPGALVFDSTGTLCVANGSGQIRIDQVSPAGVVTPFATNFTTTGYGLGFFALPIPEPAIAIIFPMIAVFASARRARLCRITDQHSTAGRALSRVESQGPFRPAGPLQCVVRRPMCHALSRISSSS